MRGVLDVPEWPDLEALKERLEAALAGATCTGARVVRPTVLRMPVAGTLDEALRGRRLMQVRHRGKFLVLAFSEDRAAPLPVPSLVVNPMLTGLFELARPGDPLDPETCILFEFGAVSLRYIDGRQMGKVYWVPEAGLASIVAGWQRLGPEANLEDLDEGQWVRRARRHRHEVRNLLMHQEFVAGIGNAYADEILWRAGFHPKRPTRSLSDDDLRHLYRTIRALMAEALDEVRAGLPANLKAKVRHFFAVRGHAGEPCSRCGTRIVRRSLGYLETDFCPRCQPAPPGQLY